MEQRSLLFPPKKCTKCGSLKESIDFHRDSRKKDGLTSWCKACAIESTRNWQRRHTERVARVKDDWREKNPDKVRKQIKRAKLRAKLGTYSREYALQRRGLTMAAYSTLLESQGFGCAICGVDNNGQYEFSVDHDHRCCKGIKACDKCRRGLLCNNCNFAICIMEKIPGWEFKAREYLAKYHFPRE